jgi:hypothetical protein
MTTLNKPETREPTYSELLDILLRPSDAVWNAPAPTAAPIALAEPTAAPIALAEPTAAPIALAEPTAEPTAEPKAEPTAEPKAEPKAEPTAEPKAEPIAEIEETAEPTAESVLDKCNNFWREFNKMVKDYQNERTRVFELEDKTEAIAEEEKVNELWVPRINALWEQGRTISSRK